MYTPSNTDRYIDCLTKREFLAALMCAADAAQSDTALTNVERATWAVRQADELLRALDEEGA